MSPSKSPSPLHSLLFAVIAAPIVAIAQTDSKTLQFQATKTIEECDSLLQKTGTVEKRVVDLQHARDDLKRCYDEFVTTDDSADAAFSLIGLGKASLLLHKVQDAAHYFERATELAAKA